MNRSKLYAVIMAGGRGERFWPAGRHDRPKQLLSLLGEHTMIEETVQRLFPLILPENLLVITNTHYVNTMRELLPIPAENIIGEPEGRDTAPCAALAAAMVLRRDSDATLFLLPADHVIRPAKNLQDTLLLSAEQAQSGHLVTLGITPNFPATGYGYIQTGERIAPGFYRVLGFKEKPDHAAAMQFFRDGNYRWNSGMFIWRADVFVEAVQKYAPDLGEKLIRWAAGSDFQLDFKECRKISIDYAIMEKAGNVLVGDAPFFWNDIGSWSALKTILPADENNNAVRGKIIALDSRDNVFISDDDTLIGAVDVHDLAVVKSGNGILICPLSSEQRVKELVKHIQQNAGEYI